MGTRDGVKRANGREAEHATRSKAEESSDNDEGGEAGCALPDGPGKTEANGHSKVSETGSGGEESEDESGDSDEEGEESDDEVGGPAIVLPLYSMLPASEQMRVWAPPPDGSRLIVIATNVAETSITIPNISYVVDCGKHKQRF